MILRITIQAIDEIAGSEVLLAETKNETILAPDMWMSTAEFICNSVEEIRAWSPVAVHKVIDEYMTKKEL